MPWLGVPTVNSAGTSRPTGAMSRPAPEALVSWWMSWPKPQQMVSWAIQHIHGIGV
jgi:hypothetical protein